MLGAEICRPLPVCACASRHSATEDPTLFLMQCFHHFVSIFLSFFPTLPDLRPSVVCRVSCVVCRVSCVVCRVSCVVCRVSCVLCRVFCVMCYVLCVMCCDTTNTWSFCLPDFYTVYHRFHVFVFLLSPSFPYDRTRKARKIGVPFALLNTITFTHSRARIVATDWRITNSLVESVPGWSQHHHLWSQRHFCEPGFSCFHAREETAYPVII